MEPSKLSEILDDLKNRFASRFIFSFIIAWLLFNWKITIALFWYDKTQIEAEGCKSIFEFISNQLEITSNSCEVLCAALIYTFGLPISKGLINIYDALILTFRNWLKSRFLKNDFTHKIEILENRIKRINDVNFLDGDWNYKYVKERKYDGTVIKGVKQLLVLDGTIYEIVKDTRTEKYKILNFFHNLEGKKIIFTKSPMDIKIEDKREFLEKNIFTELNYIESSSILKGTENGSEIEYVKVKNLGIENSRNTFFKGILSKFKKNSNTISD